MSNYGKERKKMEKDIIEEIEKECKSWWEKVVVRLFPKMFGKVYKTGITFGFNNK